MRYIIIFLFISYNLLGQKFEASKFTYKSLVYSNAHLQSTDELYLIGNSKTIYVRGVITFMESHPKSDEGVIRTPFHSSVGDFIYINDFKSNQLISKVDDFKIYYVREEIPKFKWQLHEEYKEIDGVILQKATATFRGRNYTAWCDLETPISIGPWKFNNLPGLAYEITDDAKDYHYEWYLIKQTPPKVYDFLRLDISKQKTISLEEFVKQTDENRKTSNSLLSSRSEIESLGFELIESKVEYKNHRLNALEIQYEWEE